MKKFFSGNSIEQVVMTAARHFGIEPERLAYSTRDKKHGFTNVRRKVVIEVDPDAYELDDAAVAQTESGGATGEKLSGRGIPKAMRDGGEATSDDRPDRTKPSRDDRSEEDSDDSGDRMSHDRTHGDDDDVDGDLDDDSDDGPQERGGRGRGSRRSSRRDDDRRGGDRRDGGRRADFVHRWENVALDPDEVEELGRETAAFELALDVILDVMDLEIEFTIVEGDTYEVEFSGEDADLLTAEDGRALKAIEHILPRAVRTLLGESVPVKVDCEGFRADHEDELMQAARDAADEVRRTGRETRLAPMSPGDRRIVHLTLADDPDVDTFSDGRGYRKRVTIRPID